MNLPSPISRLSQLFGNDGSDTGPDFDAEEVTPQRVANLLPQASDIGKELQQDVDKYTLDTDEDIDEAEFFTNEDGTPTVTNRFDLEMTVPSEQKQYFEELDRYWVNKPYAFVIIFRSRKENEVKYFVVEPHMTEAEHELIDFLEEKLRVELKYGTDEIQSDATDEEMRETIDNETQALLETYGLYEEDNVSFIDRVKNAPLIDTIVERFSDESEEEEITFTTNARPTEAVEAELDRNVNPQQIEKILYYLRRNFVGNQKIDAITKDLSVEDISCDGYNSPVFVYHGDYEQIISNIEHGKDSLDNFVTQLAQRAGKGISKRKPQVDATLPNGSRAQLTLGQEVSDHGTNYTIRQFKEVPFTPLDLINWNTFSLEQMAFFWLAIENHKNLIFAGGTASGKTTSLNAVSLFIPSSAKIVSIEDTREVELPQRNWIASVTRPSFTGDSEGDVDEFDLLEAALRQRPDYIVMGEIRGEEGRTLFQVMSTGHTTYTTFHADTVSEVIKRFTTEPINVSKTMFTALDLVSIQTQTIVDNDKVRRNKVLTEINNYDTESDEINVQDVYEWQAETDQFLKMGESNVLQDIKFERGWDEKEINEELGKRRLVLAYLLKNELNEYTQVAATLQAFVNDPETILTLIANGKLENSLSALRQMDSVLIDVSQEAEERAGRPSTSEEMQKKCDNILDKYSHILEEYKGETVEVEEALDSTDPETPAEPSKQISDNITVVSDDEELDEDELLQTASDELSDFEEETLAEETDTITQESSQSDESETEESGGSKTDIEERDEETEDDEEEEQWESVTSIDEEEESDEEETSDSDDDDSSDTVFG